MAVDVVGDIFKYVCNKLMFRFIPVQLDKFRFNFDIRWTNIILVYKERNIYKRFNKLWKTSYYDFMNISTGKRGMK
jgi:hypothetical protein